MRRLALAIATLLTLPVLAHGEAEHPEGADRQHCAAFSQAVDQCLKAIAINEADSFSENTAPQLALHEARKQTQILLIQTHLAAAQRAGCPPPMEPVFEEKYLLEAMTCKKDRKANPARDSYKEPRSCEKSAWKGREPTRSQH